MTFLSQLQFRAVNLDFGTGAVDGDLPGATTAAPGVGFGNLISQVLNISLTVGVIAVLFYLIWGGIDYITAGGDKGKTEKAREKITQAVIGLIVLVSAIAIMMFIQQLLDICLINFAGSCAPKNTGVLLERGNTLN